MKKIISLIFLLIVTSCSQLFAYDIKQENVLLQQLNSAPNDSTKLKILYELATVTTDEQERNTHYINVLLEEADKQNNSNYKCQAYLLHIVAAFNMYDVEAVQKWNALLEPIARKAKLYSLMFEGRRAAIDVLNTKRQNELVEKEANKMLKESIELKSEIGIAYAYQSLGYVNGFNFRYEESAVFFEKSYALFTKLNKIVSMNEVCDRLIGIYRILKKNPQRLRVIQKQEEIVAKQAKEVPINGLREDFLINNLNYLEYYLDVDNLVQAEKYMRLAEQNYFKGYAAYDEIYHSARIAYFDKTQNKVRAVAEIDTLIGISSNATTINSLEFTKARLLEDMENYGAALALYKKAWPTKDSLRIDLLNRQTEQLKKDYNADALLLRKQQTSYFTQLSFIILIVVTILVLIGFMIHTYRAQRILSRAEKEQKKLNEDMLLANIAKEKFITNISSSIRKPLNSVLKNSLILASYQKLDLEERKNISQSITTTSHQLMKLINNILDLSHLEAKMMKYNVSTIEITSALKSIIAEDLHITAYIEVGKLIWIKMDNNRLIQVVKSIIESPRSTIPISIYMEQLNKESVNIEIHESHLTVSDPPQDVIINNEINGMIIADFNGKYNVHSSTGVISITFPVTQIQSI